MSHRPFAHEFTLAWPGEEDERAPGGAITLELCGSVDHPPPCPLAPHFTGVVHRDETLELRVLFACEPEDEAAVRAGIERALGRWTVLASAAAPVREDEAEHAARLAATT